MLRHLAPGIFLIGAETVNDLTAAGQGGQWEIVGNMKRIRIRTPCGAGQKCRNPAYDVFDDKGSQQVFRSGQFLCRTAEKVRSI